MTLWTPREKFVEMCIDNEGLSKIAIIGNLYSVFGIGVLIRNYLSNPKLRSLVITGTELGNSRSVMEKLNTRENIADIAKNYICLKNT